MIGGIMRKYWLVFVVLLASLAALSYRHYTHPASQTITIGTFSKALGNAPYYVAKKFGWFEQHEALRGRKILYVEYNDRPTIAAAFARSELDLLFSAEIPSILIRAQGEDVRIVLVSTYAAQEVLVPISSPVRKVTDLRGRSIVVQSGTSSHFGH